MSNDEAPKPLYTRTLYFHRQPNGTWMGCSMNYFFDQMSIALACGFDWDFVKVTEEFR